MYQSFYNLSGKPFRLSPDPAFFFPSRGHKRALAYLRYGLNQDEGFVVITGAPGTGKTTLAKILLQEMDASVVVAHLTTTQLEADDMLRMVAASFGLRYEGLDKAGLLKSLENFLLARSRERKRALLVIDEAQNLPSRSLEELRMLSNLQVGDKALLQIFLLGQEQFRHMLDDPALEQLRQRIIANYHLAPLASDECQRYIESRLLHVSWNNDPHFAEIAHELIHQYSDGIPRRINMLCDRIMLYGCMEETHEITGEVVNLVKKEMDEEISGKSAESGVNSQFNDSPEFSPVKQKEPESSPQISRTAPKKPLESEQPVHAKGAEQDKTALESRDPLLIDADSEDDTGGLDIDYAMFADTVDPDAMPEPNRVSPNMDNQNTHAKAKNPPFSELAEKKLAKQQQAALKQSPLPKSKQSTDSDKQVLGNTVQKTNVKPEHIKSDDGAASPNHSEIAERDLFRVIPGGKSFNKIPGLENGEKPNIAAAAPSEPSSSDVRLRRILRLVLAFHRSPSRFPGLDSPVQPLPEGITELLELAISDDQVLNQVSPAAVMGISPVMLRAAVRFFVRRALFIPDGDHYRTLGLPPGASLAQIEKHYDLLMRLLRQDKQRGSADSVEQVGQAYEALSRGEHRSNGKAKAADARQNKAAIDETQTGAGQEVKDTSELIIDFDEVVKNPPKPEPSTFVAKPNERFSSVAGGMSRKTVRYASQLAVLGFGAVVIILGLYIVQLEPSAPPNRSTSTNLQNTDISQNTVAENTAGTQERRRGLQFNDATTDSLNTPKTMEPDEPLYGSAQPESAVDAPMDVNDAAAQRELSSTSDIEKSQTRAASRFDFDPENLSNTKSSSKAPTSLEPKGNSSAKGQDMPSSLAIAETAASKPPLSVQPQTQEPQSPATVDKNVSSSEKPADKNPSQMATSNQFEGKDIEVEDHKPQRSAPFSSIAARTATPKIAAKPIQATPNPPQDDPANSQIAAAGSQSTLVNPKLKIQNAQLSQMVDNFITFYEAGNVEKVMNLFSEDARTNNRTSAKGIQADYAELFKSTTVRRMSINALNWSVENDYARGVGDYVAQINPTGTQGSQIFSGNITIQVQNHDDGLKITRFYFSNQSVSTGSRLPEGASPKPDMKAPAIASAMPVIEKTVQEATKPKTPPAAVQQGIAAAITGQDLQNLINDFARSYANGNISGLMSLFADNAKTNDQTTISGIRQDYEDLFQSTSKRQMVINNMKWTLDKNQATGEGPFEVKIKSKGNNSETSVKGSLKMIVVKSPKGSQITEMFHSIK